MYFCVLNAVELVTKSMNIAGTKWIYSEDKFEIYHKLSEN